MEKWQREAESAMHDKLTALQQQFDSFCKNGPVSVDVQANAAAERSVQVHVDVHSARDAETSKVGLESMRMELAAVTEKMVKIDALEKMMKENRDQLQVQAMRVSMCVFWFCVCAQ
jgi:hypothetical protein